MNDPERGELHDLIQRAIAALNRGDYWETHEILEEYWLEDRSPRRDCLKGLIQLAAGYHHGFHGRLAGALSLLEKGQGYLRPCHGPDSPGDLGLDLPALLDQAATARAWLAEHGVVPLPASLAPRWAMR